MTHSIFGRGAIRGIVFASAAITTTPAFAGLGQLNLGVNGALSNPYSITDLASGTTFGQNNSSASGPELVGNGVALNFSGGNHGGYGTIYYDSSVANAAAQIGNLQPAPASVLVPTSLTNAYLSQSQSVASYAASLAATQNFGSISNNQIINGNGGINVIDIGSLNNVNFTLNGSTNDYFVINVSGSVNTNRVMSLTGGIGASHILWNFTGSGTVFQTSGGDQLYGTFLATQNGAKFQFSDLILTGALINTGGNVQYVSNGQITNSNFSVPLPPSVGLLALGLFALIGVARREKRDA